MNMRDIINIINKNHNDVTTIVEDSINDKISLTDMDLPINSSNPFNAYTVYNDTSKDPLEFLRTELNTVREYEELDKNNQFGISRNAYDKIDSLLTKLNDLANESALTLITYRHYIREIIKIIESEPYDLSYTDNASVNDTDKDDHADGILLAKNPHRFYGHTPQDF